MKKVSAAISFVATGVSFLSLTSFAYADTICATGQFRNLCNLKLNAANNIVGAIMTIILGLALALALIFLSWGGVRWIMSGGDKAKIEQARGTITAAIIGLVLALLTYFILNIVTFLFTKQSFTSFTIPTIVP